MLMKFLSIDMPCSAMKYKLMYVTVLIQIYEVG